jgi:hypothetical protein
MGKTPIGRATIHVLGINESARVAQRALLMELGRWPEG